MKKSLICLVVIAVVATITLLSVQGYAGTSGWRWPRWRLYDNFNYSGPPDPNRWNIDDSSAAISIVNGKAQFVHTGPAEDSAWLIIKQAPERVRGIRVTVTVESCEDAGDVRGRIGGYIGKVEDDYVWDQLVVETFNERVWCGLAALEPDTWDWVYDLFSANFGYPMEIIGNPFTITMIFSRNLVTYEVRGLGEIVHFRRETLDPTDNYFMGIGTRSRNPGGSCVVYFDDVYVLY